MAIIVTYQNQRRTHVQVQLTTAGDTLGPITGPAVVTVPCDGSYQIYQAIIAQGLVPGISNPSVNQPPYFGPL